MSPAQGPRALDPVPEPHWFPQALLDAEWPAERGRPPRVGFGLSGGGIRSATLSLGFFQGLARLGLLRKIDYLSTVSGGGYFGAFYGHLIQRVGEGRASAAAREGSEGDRPPTSAVMAEVERELADPASRSVSFLRENGRYLSPNGSGDLLLAGAIALRNWVAVVYVMGSLALFVLSLVVAMGAGARVGMVEWFGISVVGIGAEGALPVWLSPLFPLATLALLLFAVPPGWAYWLVPATGPGSGARQLVGQWAAPIVGVGVGGAVAFGWILGDGNGPVRAILLTLGLLSALTLARYALALVSALRRVGTGTGEAEVEGRRAEMRRTLSRGMTRGLLVVGGLLLLGTVDTIGAGVVRFAESVGGGTTLTLYGVLVAGVGAVRRGVARLAGRLQAHARPPLPLDLLIQMGAVLLLLALAGGIAAIPHALFGDGNWGRLRALILGAGLLVLAIGGVWSFVNRSSLHAFYESRLRRAYLGATNPARAGEGEDFPPITDPHPEDGFPLPRYHPARYGGPVHLINVTVNETVDGRSQVQQRDRKGVGMAVGPGGVSVSRTHHALWRPVEEEAGFLAGVRRLFGSGDEELPPPPSTFRVFPKRVIPEALDVGQWTAISGAAFSTGLGSRTNAGLSLLAGLLNVRLGYWWSSGVDPNDRRGRPRRSGLVRLLARLRRLCPVQGALLDEWFARFPGVARREWNLSDGGHFENLAGYELLRRRLPVVVLLDNEQDPDYTFSGLATLVRLARTDFDTEIRFLTQLELDELFCGEEGTGILPEAARWIGPLESLRRGHRSAESVWDPVTEDGRLRTEANRSGLSLAHAALARVHYRARPKAGAEAGEGWLLYVKPTLVGDEPPDLRERHRAHPDFPHEPTADQFFDEAQWESYRKLGEWMAEKLFGGEVGEGWSVRGMVG